VPAPGTVKKIAVGTSRLKGCQMVHTFSYQKCHGFLSPPGC
jgi:hypothetical protein